MKFLLDQNLSSRLVEDLLQPFPGTTRVMAVGMASAEDRAIWDFAAANGFTIVSKDDDFRQLSFLFGPPPKVIWLQLGNCTTAEVLTRLLGSAAEFEAFDQDPLAAILALR